MILSKLKGKCHRTPQFSGKSTMFQSQKNVQKTWTNDDIKLHFYQIRTSGGFRRRAESQGSQFAVTDTGNLRKKTLVGSILQRALSRDETTQADSSANAKPLNSA